MQKKLWKALGMFILFLCTGGMLAMASPHTHKNKTFINPFIRDTALFRSHAFDLNGVCICLDDLAEEHLQRAPRVQLRKEALDFIDDYIDENGRMLDKIMGYGQDQLTTISRIFAQRGLPVELKYLAVIESKLKNVARSGAGAVGMWQFMATTARGLGLKVNGSVDERRNNYKSTVAAARYLERLYLEYEDWLLVIAAYNCGPGGVDKAIKLSRSRDFWKLQRYLPLETRLHVKRFISTHYYYENHGSLVTLTREETLSHLKAASSYLAKHPVSTEKDHLPAEPQPEPAIHTQIMAIIHDQDQFLVLMRK